MFLSSLNIFIYSTNHCTFNKIRYCTIYLWKFMEIFEIEIVGLFFSINIERRFFNFIYRLDEIYLIYIHNSYLYDSCHIRIATISFFVQSIHIFTSCERDLKKNFAKLLSNLTLSILSNLFRVNNSRLITNDSHWIRFDRSSRRYFNF